MDTFKLLLKFLVAFHMVSIGQTYALITNDCFCQHGKLCQNANGDTCVNNHHKDIYASPVEEVVNPYPIAAGGYNPYGGLYNPNHPYHLYHPHVPHHPYVTTYRPYDRHRLFNEFFPHNAYHPYGTYYQNNLYHPYHAYQPFEVVNPSPAPMLRRCPHGTYTHINIHGFTRCVPY